MATSKEKKRYHLTATADGWADASAASSSEGAKLGRSVAPRRVVTPVPPPRRKP